MRKPLRKSHFQGNLIRKLQGNLIRKLQEKTRSHKQTKKSTTRHMLYVTYHTREKMQS